MQAVGIIAARLESTRLPSKALLDINGLPMVIHTCKRAELAKTLDKVFLATDSAQIKKVGESHNIDVIMTGTYHTNSSERLAEACEKIDSDIIVNIQGDEPLVYPDHIDKVVSPLLENPEINVSIGITKFNRNDSPGDIKAVIDLNNDILYCSRNDIPCYYLKDFQHMWKMCFIVPFRKELLKKYLAWEPTPLELIEDNHFLRILEHGVKIKSIEIDDAKISVDTQEDLIEVRKLMKKDELKYQYMNHLSK